MLTSVASGSNTATFQRIRPPLASTQNVRSDCRPSGLAASTGTAVVRYRRFLNRLGDDQPLPGISVFQATLVVSFHFVGRFLAWVCPSPVGPRNCGQSAAGRRETTKDTKNTKRSRRSMRTVQGLGFRQEREH